MQVLGAASSYADSKPMTKEERSGFDNVTDEDRDLINGSCYWKSGGGISIDCSGYGAYGKPATLCSMYKAVCFGVVECETPIPDLGLEKKTYNIACMTRGGCKNLTVGECIAGDKIDGIAGIGHALYTPFSPDFIEQQNDHQSSTLK